MLDDELRALERAATDTVGKIRYAEALGRVGRVEDAVRVLAMDTIDPEVRRAIARLPSSLVPIEHEPRRLWEARLMPHVVGALEAVSTRLLAGPFTVVAGTPSMVHVVAAAHGIYWYGFENHAVVGLVGNVVVSHVNNSKLPKLVGYDFLERRELWQLPVTSGPAEIDGHRLIVTHGTGFLELDLSDPERPPVEIGPSRRSAIEPRCVTDDLLAGELVYFRQGRHVAARRGGEIAWRVELDDEVVALAACGRRIYALLGRASLVCLEA
ncbi:MAG: hypothetical protein ACAI25_01250 [Planctomycetota bacterium]